MVSWWRSSTQGKVRRSVCVHVYVSVCVCMFLCVCVCVCVWSERWPAQLAVFQFLQSPALGLCASTNSLTKTFFPTLHMRLALMHKCDSFKVHSDLLWLHSDVWPSEFCTFQHLSAEGQKFVFPEAWFFSDFLVQYANYTSGMKELNISSVIRRKKEEGVFKLKKYFHTILICFNEGKEEDNN